MKKAIGLALAALLGAAGAAGGEEISARPFLRIETGMHTAIINGIGADAAGRFLVTGSYDKTVRVWDLVSGRLVRTLYPPIGDGNEGQIYAVAMSPDGELVAAGGWTGFQSCGNHSIYLFDRRSGRLLRRLSGLPDVVGNLAFSPEGTRLAVTLGGLSGLRVFRMPDGQELGRDTAYGDRSYSVSFAADGRLATISYDGNIRLYDRDLHLFKSARLLGGKRPTDVAFSPDGLRIAVGYEDAPRVDVLDASDLRTLYTPDARGTNSSLSSVAWSADGTVLYAAGQSDDDRGRNMIRRWADAGRGSFQDLEGPENTVMELLPLPKGRLAFGSADPAWGVLDPAGRSVLGRRHSIADTRGIAAGFRVDPSGSIIRFAYEAPDRRPARFSILERRLVLDPSEDFRLAPPRTSAPELAATGWENTTEPKLNGQPLAVKSYEIARSLAIAPDGQSFLLGAEWSFHSYHRNGSPRWSVSSPGIAWAVNITGDGRLAVATFSDGTIRWYRADSGKELLAFFPHSDGKRWVLWTPSGYYDASADGEQLLGWQVNHGPDREAEFLPVWKLRERFRKPKVIDLILETMDEAEALRRAGVAPVGEKPRSLRSPSHDGRPGPSAE